MKIYQNKEKMEELFAKHGTIIGVARALEINEKTAARWFKRLEIDTSGSLKSRRVRLNEDYFNTIDTEEKAYWLGFIYADGCIYKGDSPNSYRLQINLKAADKNILIAFQDAIESEYKLQDKKVNGKDAALLKINSTKMCLDLMRYGVVPRKSSGCKFPVEVPKELERHFIRGYFDGDGSVNKQSKAEKDKRYRICIVGAEEFLIATQAKLCKEGINVSIDKAGRSKAYRLDAYSKDNLRLFFEYLYSDSSIYLQRKYDTFVDFLNANSPLQE